ncbi:MAG: hemolysin family protein [bacterium]|nr:hemolysin family protein [bacterium]
MTIPIVILVILIILSAFFSGSEVALLSITPIRVRTYLKENRKGSFALNKLKQNIRKTIIIILIGNNVVNIAAASIAAFLAAKHFGSTGIGIVTGILTLVILIVGEIIPKTLASKYAGRMSLKIAKPIEIFGFVLLPLVFVLEYLTKLLESTISMKGHAIITEKDIKNMIEFGVEHKIVQPEEQFIINRALAFSDITASKIMIQLRNVFILDQEEPINKSIIKVIESGYTRIPIYKKEKNNIVGVVMVKNLAREVIEKRGTRLLKEISTEPIYVPKNIRIDYLFKIFQSKRKHMAVVYDITRTAVGIVTLEDLIEELVGEIKDESDNDKENGK